MKGSLRVQLASDLHLEMFRRVFKDATRVERLGPDRADVLVLAGDIHNGVEAVRRFADWPIPVLFVPGNHEFYEHLVHPTVDALREACRGTQVHLLACDTHVWHGVRFLGCTLWTDYALSGDGVRKTLAMQACERLMVDHRVIKGLDNKRRRFMPEDALAIHERERAWLLGALGEVHEGPTVAITHHGVHPKSVHPRFAHHPGNPGFISNLGAALRLADLWIHGHVHDSFDYTVGATRVVVNPGSYALNLHQAKHWDELIWENPRFDPAKVVRLQW